MKVTVEREVAGRTLSLTTGEIAKQAAGAVLIQYGETVVLVAAQNGPGRPGIDFFPLTCDYRERAAAAGKFPGGFLKREGRPTTREILTARLTDRPIRPLFPEGYTDEVQVMSNVLAFDQVNDPDVLSIIGASAALCLAPVPFQGPIGAVRVGMIGEEFRLLPTAEEMETSTLDLIVAGNRESVLMIEGFAQQLPEDRMADAIMFAHRAIIELCDLQEELRRAAGREATPAPAPAENPFAGLLRETAYGRFKEAKQGGLKQDRSSAVRELKESLVAEHFPEGAEVAANGGTRAQFGAAFYELENRVVRDLILEGKRLDGRGWDDLRQVSCAVSVLP
ncbi:MAG: polyribonucleotide nucleotidyltransferase, partial [Planctomycetales bacterium 12-60-4]